MRKYGSIVMGATRKRRKQLHQPSPKVNRQTQNRSQLDDDRKHLPITVSKANVQQHFRDSQMRCRANWKEFCKAFNNPKDKSKQIVVQTTSRVRRNQI